MSDRLITCRKVLLTIVSLLVLITPLIASSISVEIHRATDLELIQDIEESSVTPPERFETPHWLEHPTNQSLEYGERFGYRLNVSEESVIIYWFVSDTTHFRIAGGIVKDNMVLEIGVYPLTVRAWDQYYDYCDAFFYVIVDDTHMPAVNSPDDIEFVRGDGENHTITWYASDQNPEWYTIEKNNLILEDGYWAEDYETFDVSLDALWPGTYIYTLTLEDHGENIVSDSVLVHVRQNETHQGPSTSGSFYETERWEITENPYFSVGYMAYMEMFAIIVISGLAGMVMIASVAGKKHEFGFE